MDEENKFTIRTNLYFNLISHIALNNDSDLDKKLFQFYKL